MRDMVPDNGTDTMGSDMLSVGEACVQFKVRPMEIPYAKVSPTVPDAEIATWLGRPVIKLSGTVPSAVGFFSFYDLTWGNLSTNPIWERKLRNYLGFRATVVATLKVSATPFHAGILRLWYDPNIPASFATDSFIYQRLERPCTFVKPGMNMNFQDTTELVMRIPWSSPVPYMDVTNTASNPQCNLGRIGLTLLTDATPASGTVSPTYTMYLHLEDIELVGRTVSGFTGVAPQMGLVEDLQQTRAISSTLLSAGKIGHVLARGFRSVPLLPTAFDTFGKFARLAGGYAAALGFSKPNVSAPPSRMVKMKDVFTYNDTGGDLLTVAATSHDAGLPVEPVFGCNVNEMSIDYISQVEGLISDTAVTTQAAETLVYSCVLSPSSLFFQSTRVNFPIMELGLNVTPTAPFTSVCISPSFGAAMAANLWAGGFKFRFSLSKTKFHTGRLAVVFSPSVSDANHMGIRGLAGWAYPTYPECEGCLRKEVDIRGLSEFEFEVPYTCTQEALPFTGYIGFVHVFVIDPIRSPATVPTGMRMLVSASMPGLKVFGTSNQSFVPTTRTENVLAQFGSDDAIPDRVDSVISWAKRPTFFTLASGATVVGFNLSDPTYTPNRTAPTAMTINRTSWYDVYASAYAYMRGGIIHRQRLRSAVSTFMSTVSATGPNSTSAGNTANVLPGLTAGTLQSYHNNNDLFLNTYQPSFVSTACRRIKAGNVANPNLDKRTFATEPNQTIVNSTLGAGDQQEYARVAADDTAFGYFMGFPPMVPIFASQVTGS